MVIKIRAEDHKITIPFPNGLVLNGLSASLISKFTDIPLTHEQLNMLIRELRHAKKILKGSPLIDIQSSDGETVVIKL